MLSLKWQGFAVEQLANGGIHVQSPKGGVTLSPEALEALGDALVSVARLADVGDELADEADASVDLHREDRAQRASAPATAQATPPAPPARGVTAARPARPQVGLTRPGPQATAAWLAAGTPDVPAPQPHETSASAVDPAASTAAPSAPATRTAGQLTKPGPNATTAWLAGGATTPAATAAPAAAAPAPAASTPKRPKTAAQPTTAPAAKTPAAAAVPPAGKVPTPAAADGVTKLGPVASAAALALGQIHEPKPEPVIDDTPPAPLVKPGPAATAAFVQSAPAAPEPEPEPTVRRTPRGQLLRELQRWLGEQPGPVTIKAIVKAATAETWSLAANVEPAIHGILRKHGDIFLRNPDGTFALRAARPAPRVIRRTAEERRAGDDA